MGFPGVWMTESESLLYRVVPKCACSSIGQVMYHSDYGQFYDGDIHDTRQGLHKWAQEDSRGPIKAAVAGGHPLAFTCVRNPYTRVLSAFFDKICGIQRNGSRYRGNMVPTATEIYGFEVGSPEDGFAFDQIASFRRFLLFARDTILWGKPMRPDIHWSSVSGHLSTFVRNGGRFDHIVWTEHFEEGMGEVLARARLRHPVDLGTMPRFNESADHGPKRAHPVEAFFDDLSRHLMWEIYRNDFELFGYDFDDPGNPAPIREIDLDLVHGALAE
ncbi:sulfotransferase family protein [Pseudoroseicyclus aestuarii]|uniref:Sulfotransferase family protein n=1 Tax=Pseudoroseicyclus aestuarii TaxID=1795041 RepID=A0A318T0V6_9RHOB|nr:sulfotransferase family protein [Pseudoroseicyclus aestuarii]PYE83814.1 sulfotransferase family protein [Pseudoroseicyclus aestuarii]